MNGPMSLLSFVGMIIPNEDGRARGHLHPDEMAWDRTSRSTPRGARPFWSVRGEVRTAGRWMHVL
jgi:hypothetical protein